MSVTIYVEGGGSESFDQCRQAFRLYCDKLEPRRAPRIKACGGRSQAYRDFCIAVGQAEVGDRIYLLVDSEDPITAKNKWSHLAGRPGDGWLPPLGIGEENVFLMVTCMETWFLADKSAVIAYYAGDHLLEQHLACNPAVELIPREEVQRKLLAATALCARKGRYHKVNHGFAILPMLNPATVESVSPRAREFNDFIRKL